MTLTRTQNSATLMPCTCTPKKGDNVETMAGGVELLLEQQYHVIWPRASCSFRNLIHKNDRELPGTAHSLHTQASSDVLKHRQGHVRRDHIDSMLQADNG